MNFRRVRSVVLRIPEAKQKPHVCVCLGWRMVDDISSYTFHTACTVGFGWMLMDFAFFAGVPEKPSQCFLKLLPFELSCLRKSSAPWRFFRGASSGCISRPVMAWKTQQISGAELSWQDMQTPPGFPIMWLGQCRKPARDSEWWGCCTYGG